MSNKIFFDMSDLGGNLPPKKNMSTIKLIIFYFFWLTTLFLVCQIKFFS
jgi:hypothetical protein